MGVNTTHDAHAKRWGQRYVAKSPFVALFYRNRFFEAAPGPHRATRGWIEDRKAKWNPMVPTTQQTRYCNQYMLSICIKLYIHIYIYIFVHMYLWHHMCMLWLLCPKTLDSLLPLGVASLALIPQHVLRSPWPILAPATEPVSLPEAFGGN